MIIHKADIVHHVEFSNQEYTLTTRAVACCAGMPYVSFTPEEVEQLKELNLNMLKQQRATLVQAVHHVDKKIDNVYGGNR